MKKLLACGLILAMLSSTGAMCFADEGLDTVNTVQVLSAEVEAAKEAEDEKEAQKEELLKGLEEIKNDGALTWKEKASRAWEYVKEFVKKYYVAIGAVTVSVALFVLACIFGPKLVESIVALFKNEEEPEEEVIDEEKKPEGVEEKFELPKEDLEYMVNRFLDEVIGYLDIKKCRVKADGIAFFYSYQFSSASMVGVDAREKMDLLGAQISSLNGRPDEIQKVLDSIDSFIQWLEEKKSAKQEYEAIAKRYITSYMVSRCRDAKVAIEREDRTGVFEVDGCATCLPRNSTSRKYIENLCEKLEDAHRTKEQRLELVDQFIGLLNSVAEQLGE